MAGDKTNRVSGTSNDFPESSILVPGIEGKKTDAVKVRQDLSTMIAAMRARVAANGGHPAMIGYLNRREKMARRSEQRGRRPSTGAEA